MVQVGDEDRRLACALHRKLGGASALRRARASDVDVMATIWPLQDGSSPSVSAVRSISLAPNVPAIESLPGFDVSSWVGFAFPAGTPVEIINKSSDGMLQAMKDPDLVERMKLVGAIASPKNPEEFRSFMKADYDKWRRVIKENGISLDNK